jgi:hypothetical protein
MTPRLTTFATRSFVAASLATFALFGLGCGGSNHSTHLTGQFTASGTTIAPDLVKLVPQSSSGSRVVVAAVIYGPDAGLDMYTFAFDVVIGNPAVLAFVPNSAVAGPALQAGTGQSITAIAGPDGSDPTHIVVGVGKLGGGLGNGVAGSNAIIVSLSFDVIAQGTSTLSIATSPAPSVLDHNGAAIGAITFDSANGTVAGVSTGGGPY